MKKLIIFAGFILLGIMLVGFFISGQINWLQFLLLALILVSAPLFFLRPEIGLIILLISRNVIDIFDKQAVLSLGTINFNLASLMGVAILPWAVYVILNFFKNNPRDKFLKIPLVKSWLVFITIALASQLINQNLKTGLVVLIKLLDFFALYISAFILSSQLSLKKWLKALILSLFIPGLFGVAQFLVGTKFSATEITGRLNGTFNHPNAFAFTLLIALSVIFILLAAKGNLKRKIIWQALAWGYFVLLLFTFTRSAWIGLMVVVFVWLILAKRKLIVSVVISVLILVFVLPVLANSVNQDYGLDANNFSIVKRLQPETDENSSSLLWRERTWQETLPAVWQKPWLGYGLGSFTEVRNKLIRFATDANIEAHNDYLRLAVETGLIGVAAYLLLYFNILEILLKKFKNNKNYRKITIGLGSLVLAILVVSFADNVLRNAPVQWMFWILTGVILANLNKYELSNQSN